jgi:hypothetical protein
MTIDWGGAVDNYSLAFTGGRYGWPLPSAAELFSLVDPTQPDGLPAGNPFKGASGGPFWTATSSAEFPKEAVIIGFPGVTVGIDTKTISGIYTWWCVRGGSAVQSPQ